MTYFVDVPLHIQHEIAALGFLPDVTAEIYDKLDSLSEDPLNKCHWGAFFHSCTAWVTIDHERLRVTVYQLDCDEYDELATLDDPPSE